MVLTRSAGVPGFKVFSGGGWVGDILRPSLTSKRLRLPGPRFLAKRQPL